MLDACCWSVVYFKLRPPVRAISRCSPPIHMYFLCGTDVEEEAGHYRESVGLHDTLARLPMPGESHGIFMLEDATCEKMEETTRTPLLLEWPLLFVLMMWTVVNCGWSCILLWCCFRRPKEVTLITTVTNDTRTVSCQAMVTYTAVRSVEHPRFTPLPADRQGAWDERGQPLTPRNFS